MRHLVLASLVAFGGPLTTARLAYANPQQRAQAEQLVEAGLSAARKKNYREAVGQFEAAYKLYPHVEIRHNLARSYEELGELKKAYMHYEGALEQDYRYASEARERLRNIDLELRKSHARVTVRLNPSRATLDIKAADGSQSTHLSTPFQVWLAAGETQLTAINPDFHPLQEKVFVNAGEDKELSFSMKPVAKQGFLTITTNVPNATAKLSGRVLGSSPFPANQLIDVGAYELEVRAEGFKAFTTPVLVEANAVSQVHALLEADPRANKGARLHTALGWSLLGAGIAAGGVAAGIQLGKALPTDREADRTPNTEKRNALVKDARAYQKTAVITSIGAGVLAATGLIFFITKPKNRTPSWEEAGPTFEPEIGLSPEGASLGGTWRF